MPLWHPMHPTELKTNVQTITYTWMFIIWLCKTTKRWLKTKCLSLDEWENKMYSIWIGVSFSHKKEWNADRLNSECILKILC